MSALRVNICVGVSLYALCEPDTGKIRYVGYSYDPGRRFAKHCRDIGCRTHKSNWIRSLVRRGTKPRLLILAVLQDFEIAKQTEVACIEAFRCRGEALTNGTRGGDGLVGAAPEVYARIAAKNRGRKATPQQRAKSSVAHLGKKFSDEHCAALSAGARKRKVSDETREKLKAAWSIRRQISMSAENRAKISAGMLGRQVSVETRAKIGATNKIRAAERKQCFA